MGSLTVSAFLVAAGAGIAKHAYHRIEEILAESHHLHDAAATHQTVHHRHGPDGDLLSSVDVAEAVAGASEVTDLAAQHAHGDEHEALILTMAAFAEHPYLAGGALGVTLLSVLGKEWMFRWTLQVAKESSSQTLLANAWHHRADALSSIVALVGVGGALAGVPLLDPLAGLAVAALITKTGLELGFQSVRELTDQAQEAERKVCDSVVSILDELVDVRQYRRLRARRMGHYVIVDVEIGVDPTLSISSAQQVRARGLWSGGGWVQLR